MLSADHVDREPLVLIGTLGLAILLAIYFALGHIPWAWEGPSGWLTGVGGPTVTLPPNPYTLRGTIWIR